MSFLAGFPGGAMSSDILVGYCAWVGYSGCSIWVLISADGGGFRLLGFVYLLIL